jgi:hypothetical protein
MADTGGRVGVTLRQALICHALKSGPKTAHAIGEEITKTFRKLPRHITCTWLGNERDPIESRLMMSYEVPQHCRNLERDIKGAECISCRHYCLRELAPTSTFKNIDALMRHGILRVRKNKDGNREYTLNQGCFSGIVILLTQEKDLLITICPYIVCGLALDGTKRDINDKKCIYYRYIYTKKPLIEVKM